MVQTVVFTGLFNRRNILGVRDHAYNGFVACVVRTKTAHLGIGEILTYCAEFHCLFCIDNGIGKALCLFLGKRQHKKS